MDSVAIEQPLRILGETIGFWVQTAVILLGAGAAVLTIIINGRLSRQSIAHNENQELELLAKRWDQHKLKCDA
ncbi:hypothetical protein [Pseudomonas gingeri]|uniref:Uncharacterized protein n=1 Tax=Pseudomonas gingeri TaxID=117681 RepID=A0A7Y8CM84_9PSED|nr:hypothetical protein [Pseudomonas gingeri]NWA00180.1 hypothetical protein [Pseudomonas gingeri]NWA15746.1 hypothetical protein [Pseudomonas gingeri]NWA56216.1 hypothetical protein [Pseudomonas gingeri]NWA97349.1 hypothetical protein [Pseudomonas gingeri]NWB05041.1 hypothetical protein [Pseudomonas gingeri]